MGNKTAVEIDKTKETLKVFYRSRLRIVENGLYIRGEGGDAFSSDMMAQEVNGGLSKGTFFGVDKDAIGSKNGKELAQVVEVLGKGGTGNEDVVQIDKDKRKVMENVVHQPLKSLSSITEAIGHVGVFKEAKRSNHRRFWDIRRMNRNLMVSFHQIKFGENGGAMKASRQVLKVRKRITDWCSGKIKAAVIAAGPPGTIGLGNKMKRRGPGTVGTADNASRLKFSKLRLGLLKAKGIEAACFGKNRRASGVDVMLNPVMRRQGS